MKWISAALQPPRARLSGIVYLLYFATAIFAQVLTSQKHTGAGNAVNLVGYALYVVLALLFYVLFKPVNRYISFGAALIGIAGCVTGATALYYHPASDISPLIFFGPYCLLVGYLAFRPAFLPRILGALMILAGAGWLVFLTPLVKYLSMYIEAIGVLAEALLMIWLIAMDVNMQRWNLQAGSIGGKT